MNGTGDGSNENAHRDGGAAKRPEVGKSKTPEKQTGAGREATHNAPADHPTEHQSNYGGGGENGGANGPDKR